jgi:hypothetical protein
MLARAAQLRPWGAGRSGLAEGAGVALCTAQQAEPVEQLYFCKKIFI